MPNTNDCTSKINHLLGGVCCYLIFATLGVQAASIQNHKSIMDTARYFLATQVQGDVQIEIGSLDPRLRLANCDQPLLASAPPGFRQMGRTSVGVQCPGSTPWKIFVPAMVRQFAPVLVLNQPLRRGERISREHIRLERRDVSRLNGQYINSTQAVIGSVAKRHLNRGEILTQRGLSAPTLIKRGQRVMISAHTGGIMVRMQGKALADGVAGKRIRVRNLRSKRIVEGEVQKDGIVRVDL